MVASAIFAGIPGIRARQRSLTRIVLALFCLAWLQVAAVPCTMAHAAAGMESEDCGHCPWHSDESPRCDGSGQCAYPHDPQVDARSVVPAFLPIAGGIAVSALFEEPTSLGMAAAVRPPDIPRPSVSVIHCRFLK